MDYGYILDGLLVTTVQADNHLQALQLIKKEGYEVDSTNLVLL